MLPGGDRVMDTGMVPPAVPRPDVRSPPQVARMPQLRPDGAIWFAGPSVLVVSDIHFEKGSAYARRGTLLPPYDTAETLQRLERALQETGARRLVSLGDTFHDVLAGARMAARDRDTLRSLAAAVDTVWVEGNHDPQLPGWLPGVRDAEIVIDGWLLRHEPFPAQMAGPLIAGHLHPCARVAGAGGRSVRRRCFAVGPGRIVMPAFGAYAGGLNLCDRAWRSYFACPPAAHVLGRDRVHRIAPHLLLPD